MSEFIALVTGSIAGALMKAGSQEGHLLIDVEVPTDEDGNYLPEVYVTGRESGDELVVSVRRRYSTPESVAADMRKAADAQEALRRHLG